MTDEDILKMVRDAELQWFENPAGGFIASVNGLKIHLTRVFISIFSGLEKIIIRKPQRMILNEPEEIEQFIDELREQASEQCVNRHSKEYEKKLRTKLINQLMGLKV